MFNTAIQRILAYLVLIVRSNGKYQIHPMNNSHLNPSGVSNFETSENCVFLKPIKVCTTRRYRKSILILNQSMFGKQLCKEKGKVGVTISKFSEI